MKSTLAVRTFGLLAIAFVCGTSPSLGQSAQTAQKAGVCLSGKVKGGADDGKPIIVATQEPPAKPIAAPAVETDEYDFNAISGQTSSTTEAVTWRKISNKGGLTIANPRY